MFGLTGTSGSWCASFLERLAALSGEKWDDFFEPSKAQAYRFHEIDWEATNIPISRGDLDWLPKDYLKDPEDYPFYQFHVSKALGRFAGFRDEKSVFQIVLVDPLHNLQPSGVYGYKVSPSSPLKSDYDLLRTKIDGVLQNAQCSRDTCNTLIQLQAHSLEDNGVLIMRIEGSDLEAAQSLVDNGKCKSLYQVFQEGLLNLLVGEDSQVAS
jgi:hypothetical protein